MMNDAPPVVNPLFDAEERLRRDIELLFYGYRDFTREADLALEELGLGRAHHRAIYFIGRKPGLTVTELLAVLKITKQSLARVLQQLVADGYVVQAPGPVDRRQRRLTLTERGETLERTLTEGQRQRLAQAYRLAGAGAAEGFRSVLANLIDRGGQASSGRSRRSLAAIAP